MQHKLESRHGVVDARGHVIEAGWANHFILRYNKKDIRRQEDVREWEYYLALTEQYAFAMSIAGTGAGASRRLSTHFMHFEEGWYACGTETLQNARLDGFAMPAEVNQSVQFKGEHSEGSYRRERNTVELLAQKNDLLPGKHLSAKLRVKIPGGDNMLVVVPYNDPELFYYNYKINCMPVEGEVVVGGRKYFFNPETAVATYDWGRGIWAPVNQWYWGSASGKLNGKDFGFNIGHGFGDTSRATENMIFYDGVCHKLDQVEFQIPGDVIGDLKLVLPQENYLRPWKFITNDGRLNMDFVPVMDRASGLAKGEFFAGQHQVFGHFSGTAVLDNGTRLPFKNLFGFAEKVGNVWQ